MSNFENAPNSTDFFSSLSEMCQCWAFLGPKIHKRIPKGLISVNSWEIFQVFQPIAHTHTLLYFYCCEDNTFPTYPWPWPNLNPILTPNIKPSLKSQTGFEDKPKWPHFAGRMNIVCEYCVLLNLQHTEYVASSTAHRCTFFARLFICCSF